MDQINLKYSFQWLTESWQLMAEAAYPGERDAVKVGPGITAQEEA